MALDTRCGLRRPIQRTLLRPKLAPLPREYPDIRLEFDINHGFRDIVADCSMQACSSATP